MSELQFMKQSRQYMRAEIKRTYNKVCAAGTTELSVEDNSEVRRRFEEIREEIKILNKCIVRELFDLNPESGYSQDEYNKVFDYSSKIEAILPMVTPLDSGPTASS